ncbi:Phosphatidylserine decarboxylase-related [Dillenia turbinata]|uniref:Phosphatidylserine decarboxylase-related n=1 Tax=Dillenia turbinata TaxID=194707 RepID=A0AAN8UHT3_9MAGN
MKFWSLQYALGNYLALSSVFQVAFVAIGATMVGSISFSKNEGDYAQKGDEVTIHIYEIVAIGRVVEVKPQNCYHETIKPVKFCLVEGEVTWKSKMSRALILC